MQSAGRLLLYGRDSLLAETRRWVLEQAGFEVMLEVGMLEVAQVLTTRKIDLFILCHSLSHIDCESAVAFSHQLRPKVPNLLLKLHPASGQEAQPDAVCSAPFEPKELVRMVRALTQSQRESVSRLSAEGTRPEHVGI